MVTPSLAERLFVPGARALPVLEREVCEQAVGITPGTSGGEALTRLLQEQVSRLLAQDRPGLAPQGVVSELDLVVNTPR